MISYICIIVGILLTIGGIVGLIAIFILPFVHDFQIVFNRKDDYVIYETPRGKKLLQHKTKQLTTRFLISVLVGILLFVTGMYLGYAQRGEGFWPYKLLFGSEEKDGQWDKINEKGKYVSENGQEYSYYILISGKDVSMCGVEYDGLEALEEALSHIRRENTVILIDDFAVASTYHSVEKLLNKLGMKYETETE